MKQVLLSTTLLTLVASCNVDIPCTTPDGSFVISPSFPNLAVEFATLANTAQTSPDDPSPNQYSINLMKNIYDRTGGIPIIRVGGTSGDYVKYDPNLEAAVVPYPTFNMSANVDNTTFGPNFWPITRNFASLGTKWMPQMPLPEMNETQIRWQAQAIIDGIGWENIDTIELGNEPQYYPDDAPLGNLTDETYAARFKEYAQIVSDTISPPGPIYMAGDIGANVNNQSDYPISIDGIFDAEVDSDNNINAAAAHFYQVSGGTLAHLLNHSNTVDTMTFMKKWTDYLLNYKDGAIPLIMDEANVLSGPRNITIMNGLAGAVWRADYFFYCMTIGIKRVHMETLFGSYQANWVSQASDGQPAATRAGYYSFLPAADFIGTGNNTQVAQIAVDGTIDGEHQIVYGSYNDGKLGRLALVNFNEWDSTNAPTAPTTTFKLNGLQGATKLSIKVLQGNAGAGGLEETITYGGSQWPANTTGLEVQGVQENGTWEVQVQDGSADVDVPYTSVAVAWVTWD